MSELTPAEKAYLLYVARGAINNKFLEATQPDFEHPVFETDSEALVARSPVYVSIYDQGALRGCNGFFVGSDPLIVSVYERTRAAAFETSIGAPISPNDLDNITIVISVLQKPRVTNPEEVVIGKHGIFVKQGTQVGALLLPHVAVYKGLTVAQFWSLCCLMAKLPSDLWQTSRVSCLKFLADEFSEDDPEMIEELMALHAVLAAPTQEPEKEQEQKQGSNQRAIENKIVNEDFQRILNLVNTGKR